MTYAETRDSEQLRYLEERISQFIIRYQGRNIPPQRRRTLILFPGGMGSQLLRAKKPYNSNGPVNQHFSYDKIWLTLDTFLGDALKLRMHTTPGPGGEIRDLGNRIVIADDCVEFLGLTPYMQFTSWCDANDIDWFIYGWDWRLSLEDIANFFVTSFLPQLQAQVRQKTNDDPLSCLILVGHSEGGMVVNLVMQDLNPIVDKVKRAITVAAPFYGYGGQLHRYFEGDPYFNQLGTMEVIKTIASFPGCYELQYMDPATYSANKAAFAVDPYNVGDYPSTDALNAAVDVDAYGPGAHRYPIGIGITAAKLLAGLKTYQKIAAGPQGARLNAFYSIHGVETPTVGRISWASLTNGYIPGSQPSPITDGSQQVPGDGTQPAWTSRLLGLGKRCIQLPGKIEHTCMMESAVTQKKIGGLI